MSMKEFVEQTTAGRVKPQVLADSGVSTVCRITRYQRGHSFVPSCSHYDLECSVCVFMFRSTSTTGVKHRPTNVCSMPTRKSFYIKYSLLIIVRTRSESYAFCNSELAN